MVRAPCYNGYVKRDQVRTAIRPVSLGEADYRRAHDACHQTALFWNKAVDWVHANCQAPGATEAALEGDSTDPTRTARMVKS